MNSSQAAEEIVKMSLDGFEVAARITGKGAERIAVALYTMAKDKQMTKGKTNLNNMLKSGSPLQIFSIKENELSKFHEQSKQYGVLYTALFDKKHPNKDGLVDIMVRAEDAPKVNRIVERFKLSSVVDMATIKSEIENEKVEEMIKDAEERGIPIKSDEEKLADDIMAKPIQKEQKETLNPSMAKTEKSPLSEHSLENKNKEGVVIDAKKPSVREAIKKIRKEQKENRKENEKSTEISVPASESKNMDKIVSNKKNFKGKER